MTTHDELTVGEAFDRLQDEIEGKLLSLYEIESELDDAISKIDAELDSSAYVDESEARQAQLILTLTLADARKQRRDVEEMYDSLLDSQESIGRPNR